jgi:hypothetical protein
MVRYVPFIPYMICISRRFTKQKNYVLGLGLGSKPKTKINLGLDLEFNYIHFGIEINKRLEFLTLKNVWV